ncbi:MAG: hypothetical protein ACOH1Y_02380 [Propionicimonas sp.]
MNLSTVGADTRTVESFARIDNEAGPACHSYVRTRCEPRRMRSPKEAPVNQLDHRQVSHTHSSVPVVAQYTYSALDAPPRASGSRHPKPVSVLIHIV